MNHDSIVYVMFCSAVLEENNENTALFHGWNIAYGFVEFQAI